MSPSPESLWRAVAATIVAPAQLGDFRRQPVRRMAVSVIVGFISLAAASCGGSSSSSGGSGGGSASSTAAGAASGSGGSGGSTGSGSATASLTAGSMQYSFSGGKCTPQNGTFTVNIGTPPTPGTAGSQGVHYFGMTVGAVPQPDGSTVGQPVNGDGTFPIAVMTANQNGSYTNITNGTVTIAGGMTKGTFSGTGTLVQGTSMQQNQPISGTFSC